MTLEREDRELSPASDDVVAGRRLPGLILALASVVPAVVAAAWVASALLLLLLHVYRPVPATVLGLGFAFVLARPAVRVARAAADRFDDVPWWVLIAVLVIVTAAGVLAFAHSAEDVLIRRDPGSYAMSATWLSTHGTINMPTHAALFGPTNPHLVLASQGFYEQGSHIIPQFMTGVPVLLAIGGWMTGLSGVLHGNAVIGSLALLAFAGVAVRLVGARWTPLAVLALALVQPELDVMRATYSEPAAQLLLLGGLAVVLDALYSGGLLPRRIGSAVVDDPPLASARVTGALFVGGLVLGLVSVVRIDAVADLFAFVPFVGWLAYHRVVGWKRLQLGLLVGLGAGAFDCLVLTLPYTKHVGSDLVIVGVGFAVSVPATFVGYELARRAQLTEAPSQSPITAATHRWLPQLAAGGVFVVGLFFFLRPHLMTMHAKATSGGANYVLQVQRFLGMPPDPTRSYYENATIWLSWYFGWGVLALALLGACCLAFDMVVGRRRVWAPAFLVFVAAACEVLLRPSITPDHPWADRRFVPVVLPGVVLFAVLAIALIVRRLRYQPVRIAVVAGAVALVLVPIWTGSREVLWSKTETGEPGLVGTVCAAIGPHDVVLAIGNRARAEWPGTLKVMCNVNAGYLDGEDDAASLPAIAARVRADGGRLLILAESTADRDAAQEPVAWPASATGSIITSEATHTLVTRPGKPTKFLTEVWLGEYQPGGS